MTGIVFVERRSWMSRLKTKIKLKLFQKETAMSAGNVISPEHLRGLPSVMIRWCPYSNIKLISRIFAHETIHHIISREFNEYISKKYDKIDGKVIIMGDMIK